MQMLLNKLEHIPAKCRRWSTNEVESSGGRLLSERSLTRNSSTFWYSDVSKSRRTGKGSYLLVWKKCTYPVLIEESQYYLINLSNYLRTGIFRIQIVDRRQLGEIILRRKRFAIDCGSGDSDVGYLSLISIGKRTITANPLSDSHFCIRLLSALYQFKMVRFCMLSCLRHRSLSRTPWFRNSLGQSTRLLHQIHLQ